MVVVGVVVLAALVVDIEEGVLALVAVFVVEKSVNIVAETLVKMVVDIMAGVVVEKYPSNLESNIELVYGKRCNSATLLKSHISFGK